MGSSAIHKKRFLSEHPYCCFCGGGTLAAEPDHVPSRVLFDSRKWPEGFEFPACVQCNRATRHEEQIVAMLSRMYPNASTDQEKNEIHERIRAVAHNYPEVLLEMRPTVRQLRSAAKEYGLEKGPGVSYADLPFLAVDGPLVNAAIERFALKLCCALYYKHTGLVLSNAGGVAVRWFSNLQIENDEIPRLLAEILVGFPKLERARTKLDDQFFYRWCVSDTKAVAVFLVFFRRSFAILGYVNQNADDFNLLEAARVVRPLAN